MTERAPRLMPLYHLFMLVLCVLALAGIVFQYAFRHDPEIELVLDAADFVICVAFAVDFLVSLWTAPDRMRYLVTWGWLDLLSAIPMIESARWGRLARVARITRLLRSIRAARVLSTVILARRRQSTVLAASLVALVLIVASSTAILHFEVSGDANIKKAEDAIWWAFATITTVGYGEYFPVTAEGRIIAAILMTAGVGLFGAFSAALAAWFLAPENEETDAEIAAMREELQKVREALERLAVRE
ncbi:MAG TPA: ion transporter [Thermoanaerobaculia bacterium]|nr:ion transporter [Thermoanaerobaculia bacterium]